MTKFIFSRDVMERYPDVSIGVIVAKGMNNFGKNPEIKQMLLDAQESARKTIDAAKITEHPTIAKWRGIYSDFGSKPRDYRCSIEALIRSVLNGREIRHINKLVDLYNFISLKYFMPVGGEDLDKIEGDIFFKYAEGDEVFVPLGTQKPENAYRGEIIYCDSQGNVLCRRWNWRESDTTKMTEETKNTIIVLEGFDENVEAAARELSGMIEKFCGVATQTFIINKNNTEIEF